MKRPSAGIGTDLAEGPEASVAPGRCLQQSELRGECMEDRRSPALNGAHDRADSTVGEQPSVRSVRVRPELALNAALWTLVGLLFSVQAGLSDVLMGDPVKLARAALIGVVEAYPWLLLTPLMFRL